MSLCEWRLGTALLYSCIFFATLRNNIQLSSHHINSVFYVVRFQTMDSLFSETATRWTLYKTRLSPTSSSIPPQPFCYKFKMNLVNKKVLPSFAVNCSLYVVLCNLQHYPRVQSEVNDKRPLVNLVVFICHFFDVPKLCCVAVDRLWSFVIS